MDCSSGDWNFSYRSFSLQYAKTSKYDTLGFSMYCRVCGDKINGLKCPNCTQKKNDLR